MSDDEYWAYAEVGWGERPLLWTTEPSVVDQILAELQKLIPSARVASSDPIYERLGIRLVSFDRLQDMDVQAPHAIVAILCKLGWEPVSQSSSSASSFTFELRKHYGPPNP